MHTAITHQRTRKFQINPLKFDIKNEIPLVRLLAITERDQEIREQQGGFLHATRRTFKSIIYVSKMKCFLRNYYGFMGSLEFPEIWHCENYAVCNLKIF